MTFVVDDIDSVVDFVTDLASAVITLGDLIVIPDMLPYSNS